MVKEFPLIERFAMSPMSIEIEACLHQIGTNDPEDTVHRFAVFSTEKKNRKFRCYIQSLNLIALTLLHDLFTHTHTHLPNATNVNFRNHFSGK